MNIVIVVCTCLTAVGALLIAAFTFLSHRNRKEQSRLDENIQRSNQDALRIMQESFREQLKFQTDSFERRIAEMDRRHAAEIQEIHNKTASDFEVIASRTLLKQTEQIKKINDETLDNILDPLRRKLDDFNRTVTECYVNENASRQSLSDQVERLMKLNMTIGEEARHLTSALKGDSKVQGDWGEMILETILENAGLIRDVNFLVQPTTDLSGKILTGNDGKRLRPDVVLLLPDHHRMIIDSKVSVTAYARMCEANNTESYEAEKKQHLHSVKRHIDELAEKQYPAHFPGALEHTLMFIPNEGAYMAAVKEDSGLWRYAFDKKIVIVSPTHIFSVMQIVAQLWRQDSQNKNAAEIAKLGGLLYDKFAAFINDFQQIEKNLDSASRSYIKCYDILTKGSTSLTSRAERLRKLGAKTSRRISEELIGDDDNQEVESKEYPILDEEH